MFLQNLIKWLRFSCLVYLFMLSLSICIFEEFSKSKYINELKLSEKIKELKTELQLFASLKIINTFLF